MAFALPSFSANTVMTLVMFKTGGIKSKRDRSYRAKISAAVVLIDPSFSALRQSCLAGLSPTEEGGARLLVDSSNPS